MSTLAERKKLKVADLKALLSERGLDTSGLKSMAPGSSKGGGTSRVSFALSEDEDSLGESMDSALYYPGALGELPLGSDAEESDGSSSSYLVPSSRAGRRGLGQGSRSSGSGGSSPSGGPGSPPRRSVQWDDGRNEYHLGDSSASLGSGGAVKEHFDTTISHFVLAAEREMVEREEARRSGPPRPQGRKGPTPAAEDGRDATGTMLARAAGALRRGQGAEGRPPPEPHVPHPLLSNDWGRLSSPYGGPDTPLEVRNSSRGVNRRRELERIDAENRKIHRWITEVYEKRGPCAGKERRGTPFGRLGEFGGDLTFAEASGRIGEGARQARKAWEAPGPAGKWSSSINRGRAASAVERENLRLRKRLAEIYREGNPDSVANWDAHGTLAAVDLAEAWSFRSDMYAAPRGHAERSAERGAGVKPALVSAVVTPPTADAMGITEEEWEWLERRVRERAEARGASGGAGGQGLDAGLPPDALGARAEGDAVSSREGWEERAAVWRRERPKWEVPPRHGTGKRRGRGGGKLANKPPHPAHDESAAPAPGRGVASRRGIPKTLGAASCAGCGRKAFFGVRGPLSLASCARGCGRAHYCAEGHCAEVDWPMHRDVCEGERGGGADRGTAGFSRFRPWAVSKETQWATNEAASDARAALRKGAGARKKGVGAGGAAAAGPSAFKAASRAQQAQDRKARGAEVDFWLNGGIDAPAMDTRLPRGQAAWA